MTSNLKFAIYILVKRIYFIEKENQILFNLVTIFFIILLHLKKILIMSSSNSIGKVSHR